MKEVFLIAKVLIFGSKSEKEKNEEKHKVRNFFIIFFAVALVYAYLFGCIASLSYNVITGLMEVGKESLFLKVVTLIIFGYGVFHTTIASINVLYFSKDISTLIPLPVKPYQIILAKYIQILMSQYIMAVVTFVPAFIVYGIMTAQGYIYYLFSLASILFGPMIPIALTSLVVSFIMKITNIIKNKEAVQYLTLALTIVLVFYIQFTITIDNATDDLANLVSKVEAIDAQVESLSNVLIHLRFENLSLINIGNSVGITNLVLFIAISLIGFVLSSKILGIFYIKVLTRVLTNGTNKTKKVVSTKTISVKSSVAIEYIKKEFKMIFRNPSFFMQCIVAPIILPLICIIPTVIAINKDPSDGIMFRAFLSNYVNEPIGIMSIVCFIELFYLFNFTALTSISRDASNSVFMKYIPLDLEKQCFYKIIPGFIMNFVPTIVLLCSLETLVFGVMLETYFSVIIINFFASLFLCYVDLTIDLIRPKLDWMTEYNVVKQNFNIVYQMIFLVVLMTAQVLSGYMITSTPILVLVNILTYALLTRVLRERIRKNPGKAFTNII